VCESKIYSLESKIEELQGLKTRKRVVMDLNTRFININAIKKGINKATEQEARIKARQSEKEAKRTADELAKAKMQDFTF
jgi:succinate dehydrogenase/fumarate reductase-like Fe-S protein